MPFASSGHDQLASGVKAADWQVPSIYRWMDGTSSQAQRKSEVNDALPALPAVGQLSRDMAIIKGPPAFL